MRRITQFWIKGYHKKGNRYSNVPLAPSPPFIVNRIELWALVNFLLTYSSLQSCINQQVHGDVMKRISDLLITVN